jgi:hypothetical protein
MVRLRAPHGVTSFSHEGVDVDVDDDGMIDVDDHVANAVRPHGFLDVHVMQPIDEEIRLRRHEIIEMLEALGVAVSNSALRAEKLVEALKAACKAKLAQIEKDLDLGEQPEAKQVDPPATETEPAEKQAEKPAKQKRGERHQHHAHGEHAEKAE